MAATCPYCRSPLLPTDRATTCASCGLTYHQECWRENGGCAAYGCRGGGYVGSSSGDRENPLEIDLSETELPRGALPSVPPSQFAIAHRPRSLLTACCEIGSGLGALIGVIVGGLTGAEAGSMGFLAGAVIGLLAGLVAGYVLIPLVIIAAITLLCMGGGLPVETAAVIGLLIGGFVTILLATVRLPGSAPPV